MKKQEEELIRVNCMIPRSALEKLDDMRAVRQRGQALYVSRPNIVREAIYEYLDRHTQERCNERN